MMLCKSDSIPEQKARRRETCTTQEDDWCKNNKKHKKTTGEIFESQSRIAYKDQHIINYSVIRCLEYPLRILPALFFSHWIITASLTFFHSFLRTAGPPLRPLLQLASRDRHFIVLANFRWQNAKKKIVFWRYPWRKAKKEHAFWLDYELQVTYPYLPTIDVIRHKIIHRSVAKTERKIYWSFLKLLKFENHWVYYYKCTAQDVFCVRQNLSSYFSLYFEGLVWTPCLMHRCVCIWWYIL
jgi:hypothetical protein